MKLVHSGFNFPKPVGFSILYFSFEFLYHLISSKADSKAQKKGIAD